MINSNIISISPKVQEAIEHNKPVVALESTIISHGMPYPKNVETAINVENMVEANGAVPATIAIIKGVPTVGISHEQINYLGEKGLKVAKASRRDIPVLMTKREDGATTVAATMLIANLAGIKVFATGGIGGVHRGAEKTMDISADLEELAHTNVAVICAGAKSILDLGLTMEYLETKGVPVIGYKTDTLPAFYTCSSKFKVNYRMDTPLEIAKTILAKDRLGISGATLITNPIESQYAMDESIISKAIDDACREAERLSISGKEITPFLLDKVQKLTDGKSLESNIQLVYNNVKLGAQIASELCKINMI